MNKSELEQWTKAFALRALRFVSDLHRSKAADVIGYQRLKSLPLSVQTTAKRTAASRMPTSCTRIGIVEKEAAETQYWLELCDEAQVGQPTERQWLLAESGELLAIFTSTGRTAKRGTMRDHGYCELRIANLEFPEPQFAIRDSQSPHGAEQ